MNVIPKQKQLFVLKESIITNTNLQGKIINKLSKNARKPSILTIQLAEKLN